jgi:hypothetical protein
MQKSRGLLLHEPIGVNAALPKLDQSTSLGQHAVAQSRAADRWDTAPVRHGAKLLALAVVISPAVAPDAVAAGHSIKAPGLVGQDLSSAYSRAHMARLRVSFSAAFSANSEMCLPIVKASRPSSGSNVAPGSTVELKLRPAPCAAASPGVPTGPLPSARVPAFLGKRLTDAIRWADEHRLDWQTTTLHGLDTADATSLLANYNIFEQRPKPGAILKLAVGSHHGNEGTFRPTPLIVSCRQR